MTVNLRKPLTLTDLETAARWARVWTGRMPLGGNVVGLIVQATGAKPAMVTLDEGTESGTTWTAAVIIDSQRVEAGPFPVTSDGDQTLADVLAWVDGDHQHTSDNPDDFDHPVQTEDGATWRERDDEPAEEMITLRVTRKQYVTLRSAVGDALDYRRGEEYDEDLEDFDRAALDALNDLPALDLFPADVAYNITQEV